MRFKYPRTPHLPWSPGATTDDVRLRSLPHFDEVEVVVTEKMDGENTTIYADHVHARSIDSGAHASRTWIRRLAARIGPTLPADTRICGENLFARHSIAYEQLDSWFYGFSVWTGTTCWAWDETVAFLTERGIPTPRVRFRGPFDVRGLRGLPVQKDHEEGYVVRRVASFERADFQTSLAKWVRPNHVTTSSHWMFESVVPNGLGPNAELWNIRSGCEPNADALNECLRDERPLQPVDDLPAWGTARLHGVLAARYIDSHRSTLLPNLMQRFPEWGRPVADLVGLAGRLHHSMPIDKARGGLVSLGRAADLRLLHSVARLRAPDPDTVALSELVAEDEGLLDDPFHQAWLKTLTDELGDDHALATRALAARARGVLRSPQEAQVWLHPFRGRSRPVLKVLVGPSGTGKSTYATSLTGTRVSLDELRESSDEDPVRRGLQRMGQELSAGRSVIWDATSLTSAQRALPVGRARTLGADIHLHALLTPKSVALKQNQRRKRTVPADVCERQWRRVRWPYAYEADRLIDEVYDATR